MFKKRPDVPGRFFISGVSKKMVPGLLQPGTCIINALQEYYSITSSPVLNASQYGFPHYQ